MKAKRAKNHKKAKKTVKRLNAPKKLEANKPLAKSVTNTIELDSYSFGTSNP